MSSKLLILYPKNTMVRHKNGGVYLVVLAPDDGLRIEKNGKPAYAYRAFLEGDSSIWVRPQEEMEDGRFTKI